MHLANQASSFALGLTSVILIFLIFVSLNTISLFSVSVYCLVAGSCHNPNQSSPEQISLRIITKTRKGARPLPHGSYVNVIYFTVSTKRYSPSFCCLLICVL